MEQTLTGIINVNRADINRYNKCEQTLTGIINVSRH